MSGRVHRWRGRHKSAWCLRVLMVTGPSIVGAGVAVTVSLLLPTWSWPARSLLAVAAGAAGVILATSLTRWLAPMSFLLKLDLLFPDELPSRFRLALRAGTTRRLVAAEDGSTQAAAEQIVTLAAQLASHDGRTRGHSERVRAYTDLIGAQMGLNAADADRLRWAALLHDIGKVEVDRTILTSPSSLSQSQWQVIRRHPTEGEALVAPLRDFLGRWIDTVVDHHERWDGSGYPAGKRGEQISEGGRIVAVADAYDVMTAAGRHYRAPLDAAAARAELVTCAGAQFDERVVRAFLRIPHQALRRRSLMAAASATVAASVAASAPVAFAHALPEMSSTPAGATSPAGAKPSGLIGDGDAAGDMDVGHDD